MPEENDLWAEYVRLSRKADTTQLGDRAWAADDALDEMLDRIETSRSISTAEVDNLIVNRAKKYRNRRLLLSLNSVLFAQTAANENCRQDAIDVIRRSMSVWTSHEAELLFAIARGETYGSLAGKSDTPVATIKTWVRRARLKIDR